MQQTLHAESGTAIPRAAPYTGLRILFLALEFEHWFAARAHSYSAGLAFEEGFAANGVHCLTVPTPCFPWLQRVCAGQRFDQVWLYAVQSHMNEAQRQWVASLAPVRVGLVAESLQYSRDEVTRIPNLATWTGELAGWLPHLTHVVAFDEEVAEAVNAHGLARAIWSPTAVPARFIWNGQVTPHTRRATFCGSLYSWRKTCLNHPALRGLIALQPSPEKRTFYPYLFRSLHLNIMRYLKRPWLPGARAAFALYLKGLRLVRQICFRRWLRSLQSGAAVINLPHYFKCYSGRVFEGMAAGRPVISWEIPDRPRTRALFEEGREILLYQANDPHHLAEQIRRVLRDRPFAERLTAQARQRLLSSHTTEWRVQQVLDWIASGEEPRFD